MNARITLLFVFSLSLFPARAQELTEHQKAEIVDCALHGSGGWVESDLYADGKVRFTYVLRPSEAKGTRDLYVAFWNHSQNAGELLVFNFSKTVDKKDSFTLNNQGSIWNNNGRPDILDALWGIYTHRKIQSLLPKLERIRATIVSVDQVRTISAVCKTPPDFKNSKDWDGLGPFFPALNGVPRLLTATEIPASPASNQ